MTANCEKPSGRNLKFCELNQTEQIEKLRYELQIALRAISHLGNEVITIKEHQHGSNGEVLISPNRINKAFQPDRTNRLE